MKKIALLIILLSSPAVAQELPKCPSLVPGHVPSCGEGTVNCVLPLCVDEKGCTAQIIVHMQDCAPVNGERPGYCPHDDFRAWNATLQRIKRTCPRLPPKAAE